MVSAITGGWYWGHKMCLWCNFLYAWFMSTLGLGSIGNLTVMAVERWLLVARPMKAISIRHAVILDFLVWIYARCSSLPPLFGWGSYGPEAGNVSCSVSWEIHDPNTKNESYIAFLFMLCINFTNLEESASGRRETKITKMVALMITAFLLAWSPYAALALAVQYFDRETMRTGCRLFHHYGVEMGLTWGFLYYSSKLLLEFIESSKVKPSASLALLPALLAKSSICYNPVIYAGLNSQFLRFLKKIFDTRLARSVVPNSQHTALTVMNKQLQKN